MSDTKPHLTQDEYVKNPGRCPVCHGEDIEGGFIEVIEVNGATCSQGISCNECSATWTDTYHLSGYGDLETNQ